MNFRKITKPLTGLVVVIGILLIGTSCQKKVEQGEWLATLHEQGRQVFYQTMKEELSGHPQKNQLSEVEITKVMEAQTKYARLYELLINIFYQKEAVKLQSLLDRDSGDSRKQFENEYLRLARVSAFMFVGSFFATTSSTDLIRKTFPKYKDLDAVDLVIRSIGYYARLDVPDVEMFGNPLNPEFDRQGALDAARFREAHALTRGNGVKIAILDTGIDMSHSVFKNTKWGNHFSLVGREGMPWATDAPLVDWGYHGTLISSIATCYAPEVQITVYKFGDGDTQNDPPFQQLMECVVAACIYKAVDDGNDVISISASGASLDLDYLREACQYAYDNNRVVISGGLYSRWFKQGNVLNFPSQYETVFTVTAAGKKEDGSYGYWDICAPGEHNDVVAPNDIFGAFPTYVDEEDTYIPSISAAIPTVAALFAMVISEYPRTGDEAPGEYAKNLMDLVRKNANPERVGFDGFSPECGFGMIDAEKTVKAAIRMNKERASTTR